MHLTIVSPFPPSITGIGQYGYHVTRALAKSGAFSRVTVLAGSQVNGETPNHLGLTKIEYCWAPGQLKARQAILSRVKRLNPDLVWFNLGASIFGRSPWVNVSGLLTPIFAQWMGVPTVVTLHELVELTNLRALDAPGGPFAPLGARLLTNITTQADVTCLTMRHYADWLAARGVDCAHIPIGAYHEPELLEESHSQELLFFTTLAPFKGLELLLEAFQLLRMEYPKLKLTIAGVKHVRFPNYARELKSRFDGMDGVHWLGQTSEDDVMELFRHAQIVVLPYAASTGSSSVLYQAATWGRPVVASNLNEIQELASESNLQVEFFENGDVRTLCNSIRKLLVSREERIRQTSHNFKAIQLTRPGETCQKYIQAFNRALEKRQSPKRIESRIIENNPA
jgi:glycosyltransferase involved in cell wall biosynthesis